MTFYRVLAKSYQQQMQLIADGDDGGGRRGVRTVHQAVIGQQAMRKGEMQHTAGVPTLCHQQRIAKGVPCKRRNAALQSVCKPRISSGRSKRCPSSADLTDGQYCLGLLCPAAFTPTATAPYHFAKR